MNVTVDLDAAPLTEAQQQALRDELKRELGLLAEAIYRRMLKEAGA